MAIPFSLFLERDNKINTRNNLPVGYSHLLKGSQIDKPSNDTDFVYEEWMLNF